MTAIPQMDAHDIALTLPVDPLRHLHLAALLAIWPRLTAAQRRACAWHRGVTARDLEVLWNVIHGGDCTTPWDIEETP